MLLIEIHCITCATSSINRNYRLSDLIDLYKNICVHAHRFLVSQPVLNKTQYTHCPCTSDQNFSVVSICVTINSINRFFRHHLFYIINNRIIVCVHQQMFIKRQGLFNKYIQLFKTHCAFVDLVFSNFCYRNSRLFKFVSVIIQSSFPHNQTNPLFTRNLAQDKSSSSIQNTLRSAHISHWMDFYVMSSNTNFLNNS